MGNGYLHADGNQINDQAGNTIVLRGVTNWLTADYFPNASPPQNPAPDWWQRIDRANVQLIKDTFPECNCIYLPIRLCGIMPGSLDSPPDYGSIDTAYLVMLDNQIAYAKSLGIRVIIGVHYWGDMNFPLHEHHPEGLFTDPERTNGLVKFYEFLAQRYVGESTLIGFDILNEPMYKGWGYNGPGAKSWRDMATIVSKGIHQVNPDLLCFVQLVYDDHFLKQGYPPINDDNIVYVAHIYDFDWSTYEFKTTDEGPHYNTKDYTEGKKALEEYLYNTVLYIRDMYNKPVYIGEIGVCAYGWQGQGDANANPLQIDWPKTNQHLQWLRDALDIFAKYDTGWSYWAWATPGSIPANQAVYALLDYSWHPTRPQVNVLKEYIGAGAH